MHHLAAYFQSVDPAGALIAINAVQDQAVTTETTKVRVPKALPFLIGQAALVNDASGSRAQIQSPSLRQLINLDVEPLVLAAVFGSPPEGIFHPLSPNPLTPDESLQFAILSDPAAAVAHYGLIFLADGPQQQVNDEIFQLRATSTVQQVAGSWVNGNLTFSQDLPAGNYRVVGMRARSTDGVAARLVFSGAPWRPGVPCVNAIGDLDPYWTRFGALGIFGEFAHTNPPTVDVLGGVAAAQTYILDVVKL